MPSCQQSVSKKKTFPLQRQTHILSVLLKAFVLSALSNFLQEHASPSLLQSILADYRRSLDRAFGVRNWRVLLLLQVVAHEDRLLLACAAIDVGAAGREWRGNLGQEFALVGVIRLLYVER